MTCVILEDEIPAQNILKNFIKKIPDLELIGAFQSAIEANAFLTRENIDLIFLDINLPDISGLEYVGTLKNPPAIIITTAYPEYALSSFELATIIDYLVKPFSFDRFFKAMNKAKDRLDLKDNQPKDHDQTMFLNVDKTLHKLTINDIVVVESDRNYITVTTNTQKLCYIDSLKNWLEKLPQEQFIQVHKSFIVNAKMISKISGNLLFINDIKIPIGRTYKAQLLEKLGV